MSPIQVPIQHGMLFYGECIFNPNSRRVSVQFSSWPAPIWVFWICHVHSPDFVVCHYDFRTVSTWTPVPTALTPSFPFPASCFLILLLGAVCQAFVLSLLPTKMEASGSNRFSTGWRRIIFNIPVIGDAEPCS